MDSYRKINRAFELISIGTSAIITKAITDWLQTLRVQQIVVLTLTFVLVYLLNEVLTWIFKNIFSNFESFRRYTLREEFIEGIWIEFSTKNDILESIGIVLIKPEKEGYGLSIYGENYKYISGQELSLNYRFSSKNGLAKLNFPILDFAYINRLSVPINGRQSVEGVAQVTFSSIQGIPLRYHASFYLSEDGRVMNLEGWKIQDRDDLKKIQNDPTNLSKIIEKYITIREKINRK